jgi:hypothetical protein
MAEFEDLSPEEKNRLIAARDEGWARMRDQRDHLDLTINIYEQLAAEDDGDAAMCARFVLNCMYCVRGELKYREVTGNID